MKSKRERILVTIALSMSLAYLLFDLYKMFS